MVRLIVNELHRDRAIEERDSSRLEADAITIFDQLYDKLHELNLPIKTKEECRERSVTLRPNTTQPPAYLDIDADADRRIGDSASCIARHVRCRTLY